MTRHLQTCHRCGGKTRHADRRCARCRHRRNRLTILRTPPANLRAPTQAELAAGIEIGHLAELTDVVMTWHGTDCNCPTCIRDRIPGRFA